MLLNSPPRGLPRAFASSYFTFAVTIASSLLLTPLLLRRLGPEQYGLWLTASSWLAYLSLTSAGFPQATQNRAASAYSEGRGKDITRTLLAAAWATVALTGTATAILALAVGSGAVGRSFHRASLATRQAAVPVVALVAGAYLASLPSQQFLSVLRAIHRIATAELLTACGIILAGAAGLLVVLLHPTVLTFAIGQAAATVVTALFVMVTTVRTLHHLGLRLRECRVDVREVRTLLSPSALFFLISAAGALIWSTDNLVIAWRLGAARVTPYAISLRLTTIGSSAIGAVVVTLLPSVTTLWSTHRMDKLRSLSVAATRVTCGLTAVLAVEFIIVGRAFIIRWAGPAGLASKYTFGVFILLFCIRSIGQSMELVVIGVSRHKLYAAIAVGEGILNLVLSVILVGRLGVLGVALGTLIAHVMGTGWFLPAKAMRLLGLSPLSLGRSALAALVPAAAAMGVGALVAAQISLESWISLVVTSVSIAVTYAAAYFVLALTTRERIWIRDYVSSQARRMRMTDEQP